MTDLIVCLTKQKGIYEHVKKVIEGVEWQNIYGFCTEEISTDFKKDVEIIRMDMSKTISELSLFVEERLKGRLNDLEVALNIVAGTGKEHTAIISAVLKLGFGIRLVALTPKGVRTI